MPRYRYLGTNDEADSCSCCGKQNLKRVVWLVELDEDGNEQGEPAHYGTTCAAHLLRGSCGKKPSVSVAKTIIDEAAEAENKRLRSVFDASYAATRDALRGLRPPAAIIERNKYDVPVVRVGDAVATYGSRWDTDAQNERAWDLNEAKRRAQDDWFHNRILDAMQERGMPTTFSRHRGKNPTEEDLDRWEAEHDAWNALRDARIAEFKRDGRTAFARDGMIIQPAWSDDGDWKVVLTRSARPGAVYQVTDFRNDEPLGHREFDDLDAALEDLWHHAPDSIKGLPPMPNPSSRAHAVTRRIARL